MIGQATFVWYVRQVFARSHDPAYLIGHPLVGLLIKADMITSPDALREVLVSTIDAVRPPPGTSPGSSTERRWRSLALRHADGLSFKQIAQQLQVSERQALRDHKDGVEAVAAFLWARYRQHEDTGTTSPAGVLEENNRPLASLHSSEDLESGLARVAALSAENAVADLAEALRNVLGTTRNLSAARGVDIHVGLLDAPLPVTIEPSVLRQILICVLSAAFESGETPRVDINFAMTADIVSVELLLQSNKPHARGRENTGDDVMALVESARRLTELRGGTLDVTETKLGVRRLVLRLRATQPATILLIDDNPDLVDLFRWFLTGTNYRIVPARAPSTALKLAHELKPDAIILDVMLPSQDGWQLLAQLGEDPGTRAIPVIVCSILPERALALSLGVADFLAKPVTQKSLRTALDRCLGARDAAEHPDCSADTA